MAVQVVKLLPPEHFRIRIGEGRMDRIGNLVHSDTLFSALVNSGVKLYGGDLFAPMINSLCLSSVFYGLRVKERNESRDLLFFPKPRARFREPEDPIQRKKLKRLSWVSSSALSQICQTYDYEEALFQIDLLDSNQFVFLNPQFCVSSTERIPWIEENISFFRTILEPKVSISRVNSQSLGLYYQAELEFYFPEWTQERSITPFLFFLLEGELVPQLAGVLNLFVEEGLGGERASGKGTFASWEYEPFPLPQEGSIMMLLSSAVPKREEMEQLISYELQKREGFLFWGGPVGKRKKSHYALQEGSLVKTPFEGTNLEVSPVPEKRAVAYGKALGWAFGQKGGQKR